MKLKIAQVIGLNTDQKAAQVISSVRADDNAFMAVLELTSDDAFTKGRQLLSELEDFYFESEGGTGEKLNATFKRGGEKLGESEFSLGLAAISNKALYLIGKGQVEVYLKRGDKLSSLLSVGGSSELISGFLQEEDKLLLATKSLVNFLGTELEKSLNLAIDTFEEEVESKIGSSNLDNQGLAGLVIEVSPSVEGEDVEIAPLPPTDTDQKFSQYTQDSPGKLRLLLQAILSKALNIVSHIRKFFPRSGRGRLILAVSLIVIIVLGAGLQYKLNRDQERRLQFNQALQEAKDNFNAAKSLALLNPTEAKNKLDLAKDKVNSSLALKPKDSEAENLKKQIEEDSAAILQQSNISDFPVFLDMDLVKKNFRAVNLSLSADKLLLLDPVVKTLVVIDLTKKSNQILAGEEQLGDASVASLNGALAFIYSKDKGVLKIDITNQKLAVVSKKDSEWGEIVDIYGFAGNVYALDKGNPPQAEGQIWKYLPTPDGYSGKREYLSKEVDFKEAVRMQIESSVYVLASTGEILRFTRGDKDNFSLEGLPGAVSAPKSLFVSSETDNLYLLDSGNKRLLILTKTGSFKGEIKGDKFGQASDLAVDEKNKKIYLLDGGKIYTADLK